MKVSLEKILENVALERGNINYLTKIIKEAYAEIEELQRLRKGDAKKALVHLRELKMRRDGLCLDTAMLEADLEHFKAIAEGK